MDKLVAIRIKHNDGTYSNEIPLSVLAINIDWDGTHSLVDVLGNVDLNKGSIQEQINALITTITPDNVQWDLTHTLSDVLGDVDLDKGDLQTQIDNISDGEIQVDSTLAAAGKAADAKAVGDNLKNVVRVGNSNVTNFTSIILGDTAEQVNLLDQSDLIDINTRLSALENGGIQVDQTLSVQGMAADAKAIGDAIHNLQGLVGTPLVAATAASMTNTDKIYVYTGSETGYTNGNWYYYDGTAWTSGGVYNSIAINMDSLPTLGSSKPVTSGGIKTALDLMDEDISSLKEDITNLTTKTYVDEKVSEASSDAREARSEAIFKSIISGTEYTQITCDLQAGEYELKVDNILSSDTDSDKSLVIFVQDPTNNVPHVYIFFDRNRSVNARVSLSVPCTSIKVYASNSANNSTGDTFTFENFAIYKFSEFRKNTEDSLNYLENLDNDVSVLKYSTNLENIKWTEGAYIRTNTSKGQEVNLTPVSTSDKIRYAIVDCVPGDRFIINAVGKSVPRAWAWLDADNILISAAGSERAYVSTIFIAPENAAKLVLNDMPDDGDFTRVSIKGTYINSELSHIENVIENLQNALTGGTNKPYFENGSFNFSAGAASPTNNNTSLRLYNMIPIAVKKGDIVKIADGYTGYMSLAKASSDGYERRENITVSYKSGIIRIPATGLAYMLLKHEDSSTITPEEGREAVTFIHRADALLLPDDPYKNIVWNKVKDVTSVTHVHCTSQEAFDALAAHYDHAAISNYHPSFPYYPAEDYFTNTGTIITSPNAEQHAFSDVSAHLHLNGVGSFVMSGETYVGTVGDMIDEAMRTLKYPNGGGVTFNHPKWTGATKETIESCIFKGGIFAMEIWNASCEQINQKGYSLDLWDEVLSDGIQIYGVAAPDHEVELRPNENRQPFGYNHMLVIGKTEEEILSAYRMGHFYTTLYNDGLLLKNFALSGTTLSIEVSEASTFIFTTATRTVTVTTASTTAEFTVQDGDIYVRAEAVRGNNRLFTNAIML